MSIYENCLLIGLEISMPPKTRKAVGASAKVEQAYRTAIGRAKVTKGLFSKQDTKALEKVANEARKFLDEQTLPFGKHQRMIPAEAFFKFSEEFGEIKAEFEHQKQRFLNTYHLSLSRAEFELGDLFDETNYPSHQYLENHIQMVIETSVVSPENAFDKISGMDQATVDKLKAEALEQQARKLEEAMKSLVKRLLKTLTHMVTRLVDEDAKFKNTLVSNIHDSVEAIRGLNITDDAELNTLADRVEEILTGISAQELRNDKELRKETAKEAKEIIDRLADYF